MGSQPMVLIARLDDGRSLYAVEREERGLYVLLHLGSWVNLQQLRAAAVVSRQESHRASDRPLGLSTMPQEAPLMTAESSKYSKKKRLAIQAIQSMVKRPSISISADATPTEIEDATVPQDQAKDSHSQKMLDTSPILGDISQPTANEIFENIRAQYFEALYISKVCRVTTPLYNLAIDTARLLWHTLQRDHYRGRERHSTSTMTRPLTWPNILHSSKVL